MAAGAAASVVTQGIGMALGIQKKFDWKQVAMGAISAGAGGVLAKAGMTVNTGAKLFDLGANAAISNAATQGVAVAVGIQKKFDWKSVAQSAVAAPISSVAGDYVAGKLGGISPVASDYNFAEFASDSTRTIVTAAVRSGMGGRFDVQQVVADIFGNAIGNALVANAIKYGDFKRLEGESKANEALAAALQDKLHATPTAVDQSSKYLEPETLAAINDAYAGTTRLEASPEISDFMTSIGMGIETESETITVGAVAGEMTFYDQQTIDGLSQYLYGIGGGSMPMAVGYVPSGVSGEDAYRSMLDYVGGYATDAARLDMYLSATSGSSGVFKYSDAGVVDLTRPLNESLDYIDNHLAANGYAPKGAFDAYNKAVQNHDLSRLTIQEDYRYEGVGRGRLIAYFKDDNAPARFRDSARIAGSHPTRDMFFDYLGDFLPAIPFEKALAIPAKIAGKVAISAERVLANASRLVTAFRRTRAVEGEGYLADLIQNGRLANRKQLSSFMDEAKRLGYKVQWGDEAFVRRGIVQLRNGIDPKTGLVVEGRAELSTLVDEYSHMWNRANGRGVNLPDDLAAWHRSMDGKGTVGMSQLQGTLYHQLELLNMWRSGYQNLPSFARAIPRSDIRGLVNRARATMQLITQGH